MAYQVTVLGKVMGPDGEQHIEEVARVTVATWGGVVERLVDCLLAGVPLYRADVQQGPHEAPEEAPEARPTLPTLAEALTRKTVLHPDGQPVDVPALLAAARGTGSARANKGASQPARTRGRRKMTAEQKQAVRERMRAYWASPKGQKQKRTMRAAMRARTTQAKAKAKAKG